MQLFLLSVFPGLVSSPRQLNETLPAPADKRLGRAMWVCSFDAWRASLAATSQQNVLISLETSRGEESMGDVPQRGGTTGVSIT